MDLLTEQEKYWDSVSEEKEFPLPLQMEPFEKHVSRDMAILDIGCGYGRTLNELHDAGFENLFGIDFSQGMIDRGQRLHPHLFRHLSRATGRDLRRRGRTHRHAQSRSPCP